VASLPEKFVLHEAFRKENISNLPCARFAA
jgi:hypothetical protein